MSYENVRSGLRSVAFTVTTPFDEEGENVRYDVHKENVRAIEDAGAELFVPCGNTGEYYSLSNAERANVVEATVEAVSESSTVVAGAGGSTKNVQQLLGEYESIGVDAGMIMHPAHTYLHEQGIFQYYDDIVRSTDLPIVLYKRGPELPDDIIMRLGQRENVVGVKYAVNDIEAFSRAVTDTDADLVWLDGIAERFAPTFALEGAEGFTTGIGSFVPKPALELQDALRNERWERARGIRDLLRPYEDLRQETGSENLFGAANNIPAVKYGMELAGLYGGPVREPLVELNDQDKERAEEYYERISLRLETANFSD
jgi:4-hydroxy-tetrahydrodipicolinate synthase